MPVNLDTTRVRNILIIDTVPKGVENNQLNMFAMRGKTS
jgi:hypothetical protein